MTDETIVQASRQVYSESIGGLYKLPAQYLGLLKNNQAQWAYDVATKLERCVEILATIRIRGTDGLDGYTACEHTQVCMELDSLLAELGVKK